MWQCSGSVERLGQTDQDKADSPSSVSQTICLSTQLIKVSIGSVDHSLLLLLRYYYARSDVSGMPLKFLQNLE